MAETYTEVGEVLVPGKFYKLYCSQDSNPVFQIGEDGRPRDRHNFL